MAKKVEIVLKKTGSEDITVKCPRKVKLSVPAALFAIRFGLPPADIKPVQGKDVLKCIVLFLLIFVAAFLFVIPPLGVVALAAVLALNIVYNKNYFFNFIKKRLAEGYSVEDEESRQILKDAGLWSESQSFTPHPAPLPGKPSQGDVTAQLEKLASLKEKGILSDAEFAAQKAKILGL